MSKKSNPDRIISLHVEKLDKKLEDLLEEFDTFDYTYKPLLTQSEFEEEVLILIEKLFRRRNKYEIIFSIFNTLINNSLDDQHKFLCLVDFMINISRYDPVIFKNLPNDVLQHFWKTAMFSKVQSYIYNNGRMNYQFKRFTKQKSVSVEPMTGKNDTIKTTFNNTELRTHDTEMNTSSSISDSENESNKIMDVSLAELTKKIMSKTRESNKRSSVKTKPGKNIDNTEFDLIKKEESDEESDGILDAFDSEADSEFSDYNRMSSRRTRLSDDEEESAEEDDEDEESVSEFEDDLYKNNARQNRTSKRTTRNSMKSQLENLVESGSSDEFFTGEENLSDLTDENDSSNKVKNQKLKVTRQDDDRIDTEDDMYDQQNMDNIDMTMNNATSIIEHIMDYSDSRKNSQHTRVVRPRKRRNQKVRKPQVIYDDIVNEAIGEHIINFNRIEDEQERTINAKKRKHGNDKPALIYEIIDPSTLYRSKSKPKTRKLINIQKRKKRLRRAEAAIAKTKRLSPVKKKWFFVVEKTLDFLYENLEQFKPPYDATLTKGPIKGFSYKPAQYSLFTNLSEQAVGTDRKITEYMDNMLNVFVTQMYKRCGGHDIDHQQFVHPFEYDYIMENIDDFKEKGTLLPPIIFKSRMSSLFDYEGGINKNLDFLTIKDTKIKGLVRLQPFQSEDEYFEKFKKIVPREKVSSRLKFLNKLVTDGKSLYIFDQIDIIQDMLGHLEYQNDSEIDEEIMMAKEREELEMRKKKRREEEKEEGSTEAERVENVKKQSNNVGDSNSGKSGGLETSAVKENNAPIEVSLQDRSPSIPIEDVQGNTVNEFISTNMIEDNTVGQGEQIVESKEQDKNGSKEDGKEDVEDAKESVASTGESEDETKDKREHKVDEPEDKSTHKLSALNDMTSLFYEENDITPIQYENKRRETRALGSSKYSKHVFPGDSRSTVYCSSKGVKVPTSTIRKVLSTKECFELLANVLFPRLKFDPLFEGIEVTSLRCLGYAYDSFRPYLLSLFLSDVFEFLKLPKFFKLDAIMFELQIQDLLRIANPDSKMKSAEFKSY